MSFLKFVRKPNERVIIHKNCTIWTTITVISYGRSHVHLRLEGFHNKDINIKKNQDLKVCNSLTIGFNCDTNGTRRLGFKADEYLIDRYEIFQKRIKGDNPPYPLKAQT